MLEEILAIIAGLAGLGGFISILVNVLKQLKIVKDGQAEIWFQIFNLVVFVAVAVVYFLQIEIDWNIVDEWLKLFTFLLGYVIQILGGKLMHETIKGTPVIGYSYSVQREREAKNYHL